jgi:FAD/FMN-containing dehydrogenase
MDSLLVNGATYWLPENTQEVMRLVDEAHHAGEVICLRGSAHSFPIIGELEQGSNEGTAYRYLMLSKMNSVKFKGSTVTVAAGCHLGVDPGDPTGISTLENSLLYQLDQRGLALPDLGGITHQSVGGFLSTGSSGGSTKYSFESALVGVEIVTCENGKATLKSFRRPAGRNPDPDDPFFAVAVAGLGFRNSLSPDRKLQPPLMIVRSICWATARSRESPAFRISS